MSTKKKRNHVKRKSPRAILQPGEPRHSIVAAKDGSYVRVSMEYRTYSKDQPGLAEAIANAMYGGARMADLRHVAVQREHEIQHGEILTPDGTMVVQSWLEEPTELLMLKARPATLDDLALLDRYSERPEETEGRKAEANRLLAEQSSASAVKADGALPAVHILDTIDNNGDPLD